MSEPFDFEAFITGAQLARIPVSAFRVNHRAQIERLTAEHDAAPADGVDDRESSGTSTRQALAKQIADLRAEMEASRVEWVLRDLTPTELRDHLKRQSGEDSQPHSMAAFEQIAAMSMPPKDCPNPSAYRDLANLTADQWRRVSDVIGAAQWITLYSEATDAVMSRVAVPDFSQSVSETLKPRVSSEN